MEDDRWWPRTGPVTTGRTVKVPPKSACGQATDQASISTEPARERS